MISFVLETVLPKMTVSIHLFCRPRVYFPYPLKNEEAIIILELGIVIADSGKKMKWCKGRGWMDI